MQHDPTEDINGDIDPFAIEDEDIVQTGSDELTPQDQLVVAIRAYIKKAVGEHNSFDVLNLPQNATPEEKCAVFDEMFNHKGIVHHLRQIEEIINDKVKEN